MNQKRMQNLNVGVCSPAIVMDDNVYNQTQKVESLADELDFYDQADDYNTTGFEHDDGVYENIDQMQESFNLEQLPKDKLDNEVEESKSESSQELEIKDNTSYSRQDTGSSGDVMKYIMCPNCMKDKGQIAETTSNDDVSAPDMKNINSKTLKYLMNRDPMKEFFVLTAQSVKLNSPYMNSILTLHINEMYEQVVKSSTPFFKWSQWIEDYLHRTVLSKIYSEAFEVKTRSDRKSQARRPSQMKSTQKGRFINMTSRNQC